MIRSRRGSRERPVPGADAVRERLAAEERACEGRGEDQGRRSRLEALDGGLLLQQPTERLLVNEGRAGVVDGRLNDTRLSHCGARRIRTAPSYEFGSDSERLDDQAGGRGS
jgi:hypothetical protein